MPNLSVIDKEEILEEIKEKIAIQLKSSVVNDFCEADDLEITIKKKNKYAVRAFVNTRNICGKMSQTAIRTTAFYEQGKWQVTSPKTFCWGQYKLEIIVVAAVSIGGSLISAMMI